jgi:hypothetical protein
MLAKSSDKGTGLEKREKTTGWKSKESACLLTASQPAVS